MRIKRILSSVLELGVLQAMRKIGQRNLRVLMYHRINNPNEDFEYDEELCVSPSQFRRQIRYLSKHYRVVDIDEVNDIIESKKSFKKNSVLITFDDGYLDNYSCAYPILKEFKLPAVLFIVPSYIENNHVPPWWDKVAYIIKHTKRSSYGHKLLGSIKINNKAISVIQKKLKQFSQDTINNIVKDMQRALEVKVPLNKQIFLNWKQLKTISDVFSIGSHGMTHPILSNEKEDKISTEISKSYNIIKTRFGKCDYFSYPNGKISPSTISSVRKYHKLAFICSPGVVNSRANPLLLNRIYVSGKECFSEFKAKLIGLDNLIAVFIKHGNQGNKDTKTI